MPCMSQSGLGTLATPRSHEKGIGTQNFHPTENIQLLLYVAEVY